MEWEWLSPQPTLYTSPRELYSLLSEILMSLSEQREPESRTQEMLRSQKSEEGERRRKSEKKG